MPIGRSRKTRPKRLPSFHAFSGGRKLTGTSARMFTPSTLSPFWIRYERSAPATDDSRTSLIEHSSARPTVFTSDTAMGSAHATRFGTPGLPLKRVAESSPMSASFAISCVNALPWRGERHGLGGIVPDACAFFDQARAELARHPEQPVERIVCRTIPTCAAAAARDPARVLRGRRRSSTASPGSRRCRPRSNDGCARRRRCRHRTFRRGETATGASKDRAAWP